MAPAGMAKRIDPAATERMKGALFRTGLVVLGAVFVLAGLLKAVDPISFARSITGYRLFPDLFVPGIAVILPWWEVAVGIGIFFPFSRRGALALLVCLSAAFLTLHTVTVIRGLTVECGCFGGLETTLGPLSMLSNFGLFSLGVVMLWWTCRSGSRGRNGLSNGFNVVSARDPEMSTHV